MPATPGKRTSESAEKSKISLIGPVPPVVSELLIAVLVGLAWWLVRPTPPGDTLTSIAVLPFDDLSTEGDQEFFAHGMSEELTNVLSRAKNLRVIGPSIGIHGGPAAAR